MPRGNRGTERSQVPVAVSVQVDDELPLWEPLRQRVDLGEEDADRDGTVTSERNDLVRVSVEKQAQPEFSSM